MSDKRKLIIDTDCGSDDAVAIAMAINDENYEVILITTVCGNVPMKQATENTLTTLEKCGRYYPDVYEGCSEPLLKQWKGSLDTHGQDGMGDLGFHSSFLKAKEGHAVLKILAVLKNNPAKSIDIITLGPLTNLAMAIRLDRETVLRARRVVAMASTGLGRGNVTPAAEFNVWQDAHAAAIVLNAGFDDLTFVGWDACLGDAILDEDEIAEIRNSSQLGKFCVDCNRVLMGLNKKRFGRDCLDMADPAAMAAALCPECIDRCERYHAEIDTSEGPSFGAVVLDYYGFTGKETNVSICSKLKSAEFKKYLFRTLGVKE